MSTPTFYQPIHHDRHTGLMHVIPNGSVINISGTTSDTFTVGGKGVVLSDGSTSTGNNSVYNLQTAYNNTADTDGNSTITLSPNKSFKILEPVSGNAFIIDGNTGAVSITSDLFIQGASYVVESVIQDRDHILLSPSNASTVALQIEPDPGVLLASSAIDVKISNGGSSVFSVQFTGITEIKYLNVIEDIVLGGTVDGVDLSFFKSQYDSHVAFNLLPKHLASEILVDNTRLHNTPITANNVQLVLEFFDDSINTNNNNLVTIDQRLSTAELAISAVELSQSLDPVGFTHYQNTTSAKWQIQHNKNTQNFVYSLFDGNGKSFIANSVTVVDNNNILIELTRSQVGRANIIFYVDG